MEKILKEHEFQEQESIPWFLNKFIQKKSNASKEAEFVDRLSKLLPNIGVEPEKIIQIEVLIALSVEGILTLENLEEKAPMVRAICEMIAFDKEKSTVALMVARRLLR